MTVNQEVYRQLIEMGLPSTLATGAASRFSTAEPAIEWCFGDGQNWKPEDDAPEPLPTYNAAAQTPGVSVTHHEVMDLSSAPSSGPPSPSHNTSTRWQPSPPPRHPSVSAPPPPPPHTSHLSAPFASNNPFRQNPPPPTTNLINDEEEDEELRKALAMSRGEIDSKDEDRRNERERSVRASGVPPPSPESEENQVRDIVFGPSEKEDKDGTMALVPAAPGPVNQVSKEEEDMNRAIADSLMTASFHSASALQATEKPVPGKREQGAPLVLHSGSGNSTYAANILQGLLAIPQFRAALAEIPSGAALLPRSASHVSRLKELARQISESEYDFVDVDDVLGELRDGQEPGQLPPSEPSLNLQQILVDLVESGLSASTEPSPSQANEEIHGSYRDDPRSLFFSRINIDPPTQDAWFVHLVRSAEGQSDLYGSLAGILWPRDPNASIEEFSDILTVRLMWDYNSLREPWKIEEKVVLDRFLRTNAQRSANIRAQQSLAAGNIRRLKEKIDKLTMHRGDNTLDSLTTLIKHYETAPVTDDPVEKESREEMKTKLASILDSLQARQRSLTAELEKEEMARSSTAFDTDDPELNKHAYLLRAVMFHDGALVAGQHLYMYLRQDDGTWWRIQDHQASKVDFATIASDRTGLFMDGGPYTLLYSREGARPDKPLVSIDEPTAPNEIEREQAAAEGSTMSSTLASEIEETSVDASDGDVAMS
ncbi:hypothetical protein DB88DRAFT_479018 [Papiliotrema laurentii]|uniref:USP domain-containing protein n=1 Tax=Papiliotrema laurentii TaxID=5418 RepID=A0AAD9FXA7_PAPLA|nr:hypothetical protein DB88DRAFT_479018 [Papiliotrema laurentii]